MKITKSYLRQVIKEEISKAVNEAAGAYPVAMDVKSIPTAKGSDVKVKFKVRGKEISIQYNDRGSPLVSSGWDKCTREEQDFMKKYADHIWSKRFEYLSREQDALPVQDRKWYYLSYNDIQ